MGLDQTNGLPPLEAQPTISIIIPCFNVAPKLGITIDSIVSQSGASFEFIVVDGGSTDGSVAILQEYAAKLPHIFRFISEPDKGVYDAMNKGIGMAGGKYLYFMGAGDELRAGTIAEVSKILPEDTHTMVYGDISTAQRRYGQPFSRYRLCLQNIPHQATFYGRDIFKMLGDYDARYPVCADWAMNIRCFGDRRIPKQYACLIIANFEAGGLSSRGDKVFERERVLLIRKHLGLRAFGYATWRTLRTRVKSRSLRSNSLIY